MDGNETEIVTIDGAMAGVWLGAGEHRVEFRYHNAYLIAGIAVSCMSVALFLALIWMDRSKRFKVIDEFFFFVTDKPRKRQANKTKTRKSGKARKKR